MSRRSDRAYYNEFDPHAAAWLRALIDADAIMAGDVDERSIEDVRAVDLLGYVRCHFFAGIGGWDYALRLAGWPGDQPVWTGSAPCQPFSDAGEQQGADDVRHLWPVWFGLIRECRPHVVFGEQVAAAMRYGWLDALSTDLEAAGYAVGAVVLGAHSVGAPHLRQRLYFVADHSRPHTDRREAHGGDLGVPVRRLGRETDHEALPDAPGTLWADQPRPPVVLDGVSASVGEVCGYGNAIMPHVAAEVIRAYMAVEATP
jgi:DNA (cytosine-5)-methyltransferase 1